MSPQQQQTNAGDAQGDTEIVTRTTTVPLRDASERESPAPSSPGSPQTEELKQQLLQARADNRRRMLQVELQKARVESRRINQLESESNSNSPLLTPTLEASPTQLHRKRSASDFFSDVSVKLPTIKSYKGENIKQHSDFVYHCELAYRANRERFASDNAKILFAASHLDGQPLQYWKNHEQEHGEDNTTWLEFKTFLLDLIQHPVIRKTTASINYYNAKQGDSQTVANYANYLVKLEQELDGGIPNEKHRRDKLLAGLTPPIQNELQKYRDYPETREELLQTAIKIEDTTQIYLSWRPKGRFHAG